PDAMEGPTPVSALIHAATMVTAGVFLVCRMSELYHLAPAASAFITVIGATTAIFAATIGLVQTDIKRVIAYSTASQLGYMFFAAGVGGYAQAMFHLTTHAFFKALLFLCAGSVIHFCHHEQDMRKMGGLKEQMPVTFVMMLAGTLAITGVGIPMAKLFGAPFGFAGFVSKDYILEAAYAGAESGLPFGMYAFVLGLIAAVMTAFYSWRLIFLTFDHRWRAPADVRRHPHHVPNTMIVPLIPLAIGAVIAGMVFYKPFVGGGATKFWGSSIHLAKAGHGTPAEKTLLDDAAHGHDVVPAASSVQASSHSSDGHADKPSFPAWVLWAPLVAGAFGFIAAFLHYRRTDDPLRLGLLRPGGLLYGFLQNRWYVDDLYRLIFLKPGEVVARFLWKVGDERVIDGLGPNGLFAIIGSGAKRLVKMQSGYIYHYAFVMLIGLTALLFLVLRGMS
ncbi:MAG: proton-conducting transporter membrane subunit, partial [Pseudomonadota bacterium]